MAWPLRRYFRLLWWTLCLLTFLALPLTIWEFQKQHYDVHYQAWFIGGIFVILSMPISIYEIAMHTEYYTQPRLQKHVIRILLMVPIYAVDAWFALRFRKAREYLDPIRECYEAFVIYSFFAYLMAFLQDTYGDLDEHMSKKPQMQHMWSVQYVLRPWDMGTRFLWECKKGVLNYVILRPICTGLAFITDIFDKYGEGQINFKKSYVYLAAVTNFSQLWALYCLVMLYTAMHDELAPIRPLSKFICIKAVVFVTFWQGIGIAILVYMGVIQAESWYARQDVASGIQDFLICIEMFLAALAHAYAFPPRDYMAGHSKGFFTNVRYIFDMRDVVDDVGLVVEEHVSTATTAVVKVPQRAVKKAAQGLAKNTKKLFAAAEKGSSGRLVDEEEEAASKCALLGPTSPPDKPTIATGPSGPGGPRDHRGGSGGGGGSCEAAWRGNGGGGGAGVRRTSSGGSGDGGTEALLGSYDGRGGLGPLAAPQQHLMLHELEPTGPESTSAAAAAAAAAAGGPFALFPASPSARGGAFHHLPPLPPSSAALGYGAVAAAAGGGGAAGGGSHPGSAFNALVTSALYHTRAGYDGGGGAAAAGSGGGGLTRATRRGSGNSGEYGIEAASYGEYSEFASAAEGGTTATATAGPGGSGSGGSGGGEVPLVAVGHQGSRQGGQRAGGGPTEGSGRGGGGGIASAVGGGGGGRARSKKSDVSVRGNRSGGGSAAAAGLLSGGASSGDDSPYERLSGTSSGMPRRAHDE
ncbi:hypothetical protein PLESTB_001759200 [Pleodorina starrii]|uniref:Transmembrane protein 184C n=1 Tax=Pleodorina starrii TaxID=330485 RepID=A0A9W6C119_9CHLO|nr:hypothetical protein PLESTB_001759200 [Pleodorina starrii]